MAWPLDPANVGTGLPLEGLRVLDLSRVLAGPLCAMIAGDLGADVIKVEGPDGDPVRALAPPRWGEDATYYLAVNRHRRNVVADLRDPNDFSRVAALVAEADAVVENFLPAQAAALRVDELRALSPDAVWVTVSAATSGGPLAALPSFDLLAQARSGLMAVTGAPEGEPTKVGAPVADVVTGLYAAIGLLAGLVARATGRPGRRFEAPLLESTMSALINQAQGYLSTGINPTRHGNDHPSIAPYGPVPTADGYLLIAVGTDGQFARLVAALDDDELSARAEWATNDGRVVGITDLRRVLSRVLGAHSTHYWLDRLNTTGVPHGPILTVAQAFDQDQIANGDFLGQMDAPGGPTRAMRTPLVIDGVRPPLRRGPRRRGQDSQELLG